MREPRMCSRFHCDYRGDRYCCRDCWNRVNCTNPCLNGPTRCGLVDDGARIAQGHKRREKPDSKPGSSHASRASGGSPCRGAYKESD